MADFDKLSHEQRLAVTYENRDLFLLAGPGSGKTFTILNRIIYLIEYLKIKPERILVITFTKDAAMHMQSRFLSEHSEYSMVPFGTFHSVFYNILRSANRHNDLKIINSNQKYSIISNLIKYIVPKSVYINEGDKPENIAVFFSDAISLYKNTLNKDKAANLISSIYKVYFDAVYTAYEKERKQKKLIDFDDMVYDCKYLLSHNKAIKDSWCNRFDCILVDEFQDINPAQYETLMLLKGKATTIFAVGDDDQSIYAFRGSDFSCINNYIEKCNADLLHLNNNYRCGPGIVEGSIKVINENKNRYVKELTACQSNKNSSLADLNALLGIDSDKEIILIPFDNGKAENEYICNSMKLIAESKADLNTIKIGILFRTNHKLQILASELNRKGICFNGININKSIYEHAVYKDINAYLKCIYDVTDIDSLIRIVNKPNRFIDKESLINENIYNESLANLKKEFAKLRDKSLYLSVMYIYRKFGYRQYILDMVCDDSERTQEYTDILDNILNETLNFENLKEYFLFQNKSISEMKENDSDANVYLLTAHASKGLEFDYVIIPDCNEGTFPYGRMIDAETVEEERRLFYVAMTRAKSKLDIFYLKDETKKKHPVSRFLNNLKG